MHVRMRKYSRLIGVVVVIAAGYVIFGMGAVQQSHAGPADATVNVDFKTIERRIQPTDIGIGSSTFGATPLNSEAQRDTELRLDARYVRLPVGYRNDRVTSSAASGPTDLDVPALVSLYRSWGYRVLVVIGGRTNDFDVQPGDATKIISAIGTSSDIDYSAPNEPGNQGKSVQDEINVARMIIHEGKAMDPNFKIWGPVWSWYSRGDMKTFAAAMGSDLAGIDYHHYGMGSTSVSTAAAMAATPSFAREITEIKADLASLGLNVPVNVDELNFSWRYNDGTPGGNNRFFTATSTVWMASSLGHILKAGGRGMPYATQNGPLGMMVEAGNVNLHNQPSSSPMPAYWGIGAWTGGKVWPHYNDTMYRTRSVSSTREVFAVNNQAGGYNVVAINKSESANDTMDLSLYGIAGGSYNVYQTDPAQPYAQPAMIASGKYRAGAPQTIDLPKMSVTVVVVMADKAGSAVSAPAR